MKVLLIDFVETLAERLPQRELVLANLLKDVVEVEVPLARLRSVYRLLDEMLPFSSLNLRTSKERKLHYLNYNARLLELLGLPAFRAECIYEMFVSLPRKWSLKAGARELLEWAAVRSIPVVVLSNFDRGLEVIIHDQLSVPRARIAAIFASQEVGIEKPDPAIFEAALQRTAVAPQEAVHVGDSVRLDYLPAKALGMNAFLFDEGGDFSHLADAVPNFNELILRLERLS